MGDSLIRVDNIYKSFYGKEVLKGVNLEIYKGESMVVIGGSGSGKSVLMKNIMGLMKPDAGKIYIYDKDITTMSDRELNNLRTKMGMLFQYAALFDSLTVWENIGFGLLNIKLLQPGKVREIATEKLHMVGLKDIEDLKPAELSGGMKKRVGLARAIAMSPEILFYDEPTTGLDPIMADVINNLIVDMRERLNVTSMAITHDMVSAYKIADRIAMLYQGKIIDVGTPGEIKNTNNPIVHQFVNGKASGPIEID